MNQTVAIIGAGVSGLSCGIELQKHGFDTSIVTKDVSPDTTSDISAALWYPYKAEPVHKVLKWGATSINVFRELVELDDTGVRMIPVLELLDEQQSDPWWKDIVSNFRMAAKHEIPADYKSAYYFEAPLIEMPVYMEYLKKRYIQLGGSIEQVDQLLESFEPISNTYNVTINCSGLGSRKLANDDHLFPIRGQVVITEKIGLDYCLLDLQSKRALTYIIPRENDCVLGGTSEDDKWEEVISPDVEDDILKKCGELIPDLRGIDIINQKIGLRPARKNGVRLETEKLSTDNFLVHNYGHGGAGVTLSWGCAKDVLKLVERIYSR